MFYVSISKAAMDKVTEHAKSKEHEEVVGVLIGKVVDKTIVIEDAVTGRMESGPTRAVLPPDTIARIADDIIKQRIRGNIVGWYHSHPGYGIFMSNVDVATQMKLQQFSPYITALIIDPSVDQVGFFTLDASGESQSIPPQNVRIFAEGEQPVSPEFAVPTEQAATPVEGPVIVREKTNHLLLGLLLVVIIMVGFLWATSFFILPRKEYVTVSVMFREIPVTTYYVGDVTLTSTRAVVTSVAISFTQTRTTTLTTNGDQPLTVTATFTRTSTSWSTSSTTTLIMMTITSTTTSTSTYTTIIPWTTVTGIPKAGSASVTGMSQSEGLRWPFLFSTAAIGILIIGRRRDSLGRQPDTSPTSRE